MENTDQILDAPLVEKVRLEYAGFWIRTAAYIIDAILLSGVGYVFNISFADLISEPITTVIKLLLDIFYFAAMESSGYQATIGKMAMGIRVGDSEGHPIDILNAIGRYLAKIISTLILFIGFMMAGWDERCQCLHDKLANTYVFFRR